MTSRIVNPNENIEDCELENPLRPRRLDEYIGQEKVKKNLKVFIDAAKLRNDCLDHVLLYGPPGLGKTTLSMIIANEMNVDIKIIPGSAIERPGNLTSVLMNIEKKNILFINEINKTSNQVEEILYPAMENFSIDVVIGKGQMSTSYHLPLPKFTLIGATTSASQLGPSLFDKFAIILKLELYNPEELQKIIFRSASILKIDIDEDGALEIARHSRGTPRIANRLLKRVRDFAQIKSDGKISCELSKYAFNYLGIE